MRSSFFLAFVPTYFRIIAFPRVCPRIPNFCTFISPTFGQNRPHIFFGSAKLCSTVYLDYARQCFLNLIQHHIVQNYAVRIFPHNPSHFGIFTPHLFFD